jgi:hypothetical protein
MHKAIALTCVVSWAGLCAQRCLPAMRIADNLQLPHCWPQSVSGSVWSLALRLQDGSLKQPKSVA